MERALPFWFSGDESFIDWLEPVKGVAPKTDAFNYYVRGPFVAFSTHEGTNEYMKDSFVFRDLRLGSYGESQKAVVMSSRVKIHVFDVEGRLLSENKKLTFDTPLNGKITIRPIVREDLPIMRKLSGENLRSLKDAVKSYWNQDVY